MARMRISFDHPRFLLMADSGILNVHQNMAALVFVADKLVGLFRSTPITEFQQVSAPIM